MHKIEVHIVYALPESVWKKSLQMSRGATPVDVIQQSGLLEAFTDLELTELHYGVYSQRVDQNYLMADGDRLEIYRSLTADPKTVRREMAKAGKTMTDNRSD